MKVPLFGRKKAKDSSSTRASRKDAAAKDRELNTALDEMRSNSFSAARNWNTYYQDGLLYTFGDQNVITRAKTGWDPVVHNHIFPAIMQELAILAQRRITIVAQPQEDGDREGASVWEAHLQWLYERELDMQEFLLRAALDGKVYGYYVMYNYWEPESEWDDKAGKWKGAVRLKLVPPEYFASDPEADLFSECEYLCTRRRMPKELAKYRWSDFAEEIERGTVDEEGDWLKNYQDLSTLAVKDTRDGGDTTWTSNRLASLLMRSHREQSVGSELTSGRETKYVTVEQYWFKDRSKSKGGQTERIPEEELQAEGKIVFDDANGGVAVDTETGQPLRAEDWPTRKTKGGAPAYPHGRMVTRIGKTILNPKQDKQRWPFRRWPFTIGFNQILPHCKNGLNNVEMARNLQDRVNIGAMHVMNWVRTASDPWIVKEVDAMPEGKKLQNCPGAVITVVKGGINRIRREPPGQFGGDLLTIMNMQTADLRDQTGVQEVGLGRSGAGSQTAREVIALQTSTRLRGSLANFHMDKAIVHAFENIAEMAQGMYTAEDMIRVLGEAAAVSVLAITSGMLSAKYDISLDVGTDLPFDQERVKQEASDLFNLVGLPFLPKLLDAYERKDRDEILAAHGEYQQFLQFVAQAEEQQKQQAAGGAPAGGSAPQMPTRTQPQETGQ